MAFYCWLKNSSDGTPVAAPLQTGFNYPGKWSHYLFNDGEPDGGGHAIARLIINRKEPANHAYGVRNLS